MTFIDLFDNGALVLACMAYAIFAVFEPFLEFAVRRALAGNSSAAFVWEDMLAPILRAGSIIAFILFAYPSNFGFTSAISISSLFAAPEARLSGMFSVVVMFGLVASLTPRLNRRRALVLPLQVCLATATLFSCLTAYLGITTATLWPGLDVFLTMLLAAYFGYKLAHLLSASLGSYVDKATATDGYNTVVIRIGELLTQIPLALLYGFGLGRQAAI